MNNTINGRTLDEITYNCMMYRLKIPNEWDEHCAGSLTLKGRVETAKWAYNYIQQLEHHIGELTEKVEQLEAAQPKWISVEERLPEEFLPVIVYMLDEYPCQKVREGYLKLDGYWESAYYSRKPGEVTHWMQIPSTEGLE